MKQIDLATGKEAVLLPEETLSCAIGNFDGVHLGHKALISLAAAEYLKKRRLDLCRAILAVSEREARPAVLRGGTSVAFPRARH